MATLEEIIDYCVARTLTLPESAIVRNYRIHLSDIPAFEANFVTAGVVNAVEVNRRATPAQWLAGQRAQRLHQIIFHVYYGVSDSGSASTVTHRELVEAIYDLFYNDYRLGGNATRVWPISVEFDDHIELIGSYFVHYATLVMQVQTDEPAPAI